jgi:hypothetical protein
MGVRLKEKCGKILRIVMGCVIPPLFHIHLSFGACIVGVLVAAVPRDSVSPPPIKMSIVVYSCDSSVSILVKYVAIYDLHHLIHGA